MATTHPTINDTDLLAWMERNDPDTREVIVQPILSRRKVSMPRRMTATRVLPAQIVSPTDRQAGLIAFYDDLRTGLEVEPVLLKSAGAVAARVTVQEALELAQRPDVKAIFPNRTGRLRL